QDARNAEPDQPSRGERRRRDRIDRRAARDRQRTCRRASPGRRARVRHAGHPDKGLARSHWKKSLKRSRDRILTTHTGSLPRAAPLLGQLRARKSGQRIDEAQFQAAVGAAVSETVRRQMDAGIDVVSDGEQGKPDYSTYIKDRLSGFEGEPVSLGPTRDQQDV